jgi:RNA polymerase sigma factor (sigma-70 family)
MQIENNQRYIEIGTEQIPVTEEVYRAYKRPLWAEHKRKERAARCRDGGSRCTKDCSVCPRSRDGGVLSLDKFSDDGYDAADPCDIAELVADSLLLEQLAAALDELAPDERSLIDALFYHERSERDYAAEIGVSHQAAGKRKQRIIKKLRAALDVE